MKLEYIEQNCLSLLIKCQIIFVILHWSASSFQIAKKLDLNVADKPDSQDICFVPSGDYASVIQKFRPDSFKKGNIKNLDDKVIGVHDGIINFTIGQRKGIKIANKEPLYVINIDPDRNEIQSGYAKEYLDEQDAWSFRRPS